MLRQNPEDKYFILKQTIAFNAIHMNGGAFLKSLHLAVELFEHNKLN